MPTESEQKRNIPSSPKLQKFLAESGLCSRRKGEEWISQGIVSVNGQTANFGHENQPE